MNLTAKVCLFTVAISCFCMAQNPTKPQLRPGISVQMAAASNAIATPNADNENAVVVTVTESGKIYLGVLLATSADLTRIQAATVFLKADARANYQSVVDVLDALHGHTVLFLTQSPKPATGQISPPYALSLSALAR